MIIFGRLAVYGFMMAKSPPKLLAIFFIKLCRKDSDMTLLKRLSLQLYSEKQLRDIKILLTI